jgi:hypothetical protein
MRPDRLLWSAVAGGSLLRGILSAGDDIRALDIGKPYRLFSATPRSKLGVPSTTFTTAAALWPIPQWLSAFWWLLVQPIGDEVGEHGHRCLSKYGVPLQDPSASGPTASRRRRWLLSSGAHRELDRNDCIGRDDGDAGTAQTAGNAATAGHALPGQPPRGDNVSLNQLVAARAGRPPGAAGTRVSDALGQVRADESSARKVADRTGKHTARASFQC